MIRIAVVCRAALALGTLAIATLAPAAGAMADQAACAPTLYTVENSDGLKTLFEVPDRDVPPPLRASNWDCASRNVGEPFDDNQGISAAYDLLYIDVDFDTVVRILAAFDRQGWSADHTVTTQIDEGSGSDLETRGLDIDQVRALGETPDYLEASFTQRGHSVTVYYTDGNFYRNDEFIDRPSLFVSVLLSPPVIFDVPTGIADPSVLSSLRTIADAAPTPTQTGVIAGSAVVLMLVVGWPGALLNAVIGKRYDKLFGWSTRGLAQKVRTALKKQQPRWLVWVGFVVAAVVSGFVDPEFGPNLMSLRLLLTGLATFAVFNLGGWSLVAAVVRRLQPEAKPHINFRWSSLLIVIGAVVVARLLGFEPGVIFGLVAGLTFAITLASSREALVVLVGSGFALAIALVAWVVYSFVVPLADGNAVLVAGSEFLAGLTIEGVATLPLALLPLAVVDGGTLFAWKKWVWGAAYALSLAAFMLVLMTVPGSFGEIEGDFVRWVVIFALFAAASIAVWAVDTGMQAKKNRAAAAAG